jgi:hypothetical protein
MKIIWSKAFDTSVLFPITSTINFRMQNMAVSTNLTRIAGLTTISGSGSDNYLFILDRLTGSVLQLRSLSSSFHNIFSSNSQGKDMLIFDGDYTYIALVSISPSFNPLLI